ncbi:tripartite tricarboxylate transporter substrate binding protein [Roseomonas sp. NAR14]|uniref:Tripartite tricarboxylate transporter substrate binding protein n=1 Tax=Roseomonas acroporae TaxID=2937791 RepID=A0A9X2BYU9_9PROT|nr:tripartite tricarboxylate transporter substrate binding protein [Roseomonas acroporae]MCK8787334.1 tripartite tricarboxylate transporter substrate binding protein [Roseomonas acroporae]
MLLRKRAFLGSALAGLLPAALPLRPARSEAFPTRPVQIIVAFPPGGPSDAIARSIAPALSERWGVPVIVDNRPGAAGSIAASLVLREPADGHTLLFTASTHVQAIGLKLRLSYDPVADFQCIIQAAVSPLVFMVRPDGPRTLAEFIALAKQRSLSHASFGVATTGHIYGEYLNQAAGIAMVNVPFNGGAPAVSSLLGGQTDCSFIEGTQAIPLVRSGSLRPLAVTGPTRFTHLPDVPTFAESGFRGFELRGMHSILARSAVPDGIADRLAAELGAVMGEPAVVARLASLGVERPPPTPDRRAALRVEAAQWTDLIRRTGISVQ